MKVGKTKGLIVDTQKILIVNDCRDDGGPVSDYLTKAGYAVFSAFGVGTTRQFIKGGVPDLLIIDQVAPGPNYRNFIQLVRQDLGLAHLPIILICGATAGQLVTEALENGVDDVIQRPVSLREITARIQAMLRRAQLSGPKSSERPTPPHQVLRHGDFQFDFDNSLG